MRLPLLLLATSACAAAEPGDWPMWRHDAMRSGYSETALPTELKLQWTRDLGKPDPAFDYHFRLCADQTYEPVSAEGLIFVPSNITDSMTAYDLITGEEKWHYTTEGPVRFAPVFESGQLFFGSDDGYLYCVDAQTGALRWKTRGAPENRADYRMLVNSRMCSRWPVRGGPVLQDGTVFFGCGLWPAEGIWAVAVDAATGAVKWRNGEIAQIDDGIDEHGRMADLGLPPHGYMAIVGGKLAMASGRAIAAFLDPETGKLHPYNSFYAKGSESPRGAWAMSSNKQYWFQGGSLYAASDTMLENLPTGPMNINDFAALCGKDAAWAEKLIADKVVRVKIENGERMVLFDPRTPAISMFPTARRPLRENQEASVKEHPPIQTPLIATRHEIGDVAPPIFTPTMMIRNEFRVPKELEIERGHTHVSAPQYDRITAYDLTSASWRIDLTSGWIKKNPAAFSRRLHFDPLWQMDEKLTVRMVAGDRVYATAANKVVAIAMPRPGQKPSVVWEAEVTGQPISLLAARGHLIVMTDSGQMHCYGAGEVAAKQLGVKPAHSAIDDIWKRRVWAMIKDQVPRPSGGYALVFGWNTGALPREIARMTKLNVIVIEPSEALAAEARESLRLEGLVGSRVHVIRASMPDLHLAPYFAELVMSENFNALGQPAFAWTHCALDSMRPFSGKAWLTMRPKLRDEAEVYAASLGGFTFESDRKITTIARLSTPSGADDWSHEAANAGDSFASSDKLATPPFGLLWYSGTIDRLFSPEFEFHHNRNPYPTLANGRLFMLAANEAHAVDAYTGRHLWKVTVAASEKADRRLDDHRTFSRPTDQNVIATADRLYLIREHDAQIYDAATGKRLGEIVTQSSDHWDEVRIEGDTLFVALGSELLAMNRETGALKWKRKGDMESVAFVLGGGRVYVIDYSASRSRQNKAVEAFDATMLVLNQTDGAMQWSVPLKSDARPEQTDVSVGRPTWSGVFLDNPLKPKLVYSDKQEVVLAVLDRHQYFAFQAAKGTALWQFETSARLSDLVRFESPTVTGDLCIFGDGRIADILTGKPAGPQAVGVRGTGCNRVVGSDALLTFRSAIAAFIDLESNERNYFSCTRSGCTNSMIPAGGILNAPNFAHGCVCNYPFLTSFALYHLPETSKWQPKNRPNVEGQADPTKD